MASELGLTPDELRVLDHLGAAWNAFVALPVLHDKDRPEFCQAIHAAQHLIAFRVAARVNPDVWHTKQPDCTERQ